MIAVLLLTLNNKCKKKQKQSIYGAIISPLPLYKQATQANKQARNLKTSAYTDICIIDMPEQTGEVLSNPPHREFR